MRIERADSPQQIDPLPTSRFFAATVYPDRLEGCCSACSLSQVRARVLVWRVRIAAFFHKLFSRQLFRWHRPTGKHTCHLEEGIRPTRVRVHLQVDGKRTDTRIEVEERQGKGLFLVGIDRKDLSLPIAGLVRKAMQEYGAAEILVDNLQMAYILYGEGFLSNDRIEFEKDSGFVKDAALLHWIEKGSALEGALPEGVASCLQRAKTDMGLVDSDADDFEVIGNVAGENCNAVLLADILALLQFLGEAPKKPLYLSTTPAFTSVLRGDL